MGTQICQVATNNDFDFTVNQFAFKMGQDNAYLVYQAKQLEPHLKACQEQLKKTQKLFKDPTVRTDPVVLKSLTSQDAQVRCTYERPFQFLNDPSSGKGKIYKIVDNSDSKASQIVVKDEVLQYFGVTLCFIAQNPTLLKNLILTEPNNYGIAVVQMKVGTSLQFIYIDDYILCQNKKPLFSQPIKDMYMWPCLLEKAWFKVKGNAGKKIEKTSPQDVLQSFFPYPVSRYNLNASKNDNMTILREQLYNLESSKGCIITTKQQPIHKIGISGRKNFYLLAVVYFQGRRLFYMRNPCVSMDFRGQNRLMSQNQPLAKSIKQQTRQYRIAQGNFVLQEYEFLEQVQYFSIIHFSKSSPTISEEQLFLELNEEFYIRTQLKNEGICSITFNQSPLRSGQEIYYPLTYQVISLSDMTLVSDITNEFGCFGVRSTHLLEGVLRKLNPGDYLIRLVKKPLSFKKGRNTVDLCDEIIVTAPFRVKFNYKELQISNQLFKTFLRKEGQKQLQKKNKGISPIRSDVDYVGFWLGDLVCIYIEKSNKKKQQVRVQVSFPQLKNLKCRSHSNIGQGFISLPPFSEDVLIYFQKVELTAETNLGKYGIQSY